jgi:hypothetical protein
VLIAISSWNVRRVTLRSWLVRRTPMFRCRQTYNEDLQTVCNLLFRRSWHSFTSRTFKTQNTPVVAYQNHRFFKLRDSCRLD